jgi:general secretion pathway protein K
MRSTRASKENKKGSDQSGIALFMVIGAMTVLSVLVTEFTYVAQVNQRMAFDGLDQLRAHYLAKSGLKLSLLRLKAYDNLRGAFGGGKGTGGGAGGITLPKSVLEKIWSFPFFYPFPEMPGMSIADKDRLKEFQKSSGLDGSFSAVIESDSSGYNLNSILSSFTPAPAPSPSSSTTPARGTTPNTGPSATPTFNPEEARKSLSEYLGNILQNKFLDDPDFATEYRDFRLEELVDAIAGWADRTYERRFDAGRDPYKPKWAPFYSITELHMIPPMDDQLYNLFAPSLTASMTQGININTINEQELIALAPALIKEERAEFFKFRDDEEQDNYFKSQDDFFKWIQGNSNAYRDEKAIQALKDNLTARNLRLVTDETNFKITVQAKVGGATRLLEVWVVVGPQKGRTSPIAPTPNAAANPIRPASNAKPDPGLKITYMRLL